MLIAREARGACLSPARAAEDGGQRIARASGAGGRSDAVMTRPIEPSQRDADERRHHSMHAAIGAVKRTAVGHQKQSGRGEIVLLLWACAAAVVGGDDQRAHIMRGQVAIIDDSLPVKLCQHARRSSDCAR